MIDFNINNWVYVRLNDTGKAELEKQWKELGDLLPGTLEEFSFPDEDEDGYSRWQMHDLMLRFGHLCRLGFDSPFHPDVKLKESL